MSNIAGVVLKGKYFSKAALDKQKADVADAYSKVTIQTVAASVEPEHVDLAGYPGLESELLSAVLESLPARLFSPEAKLRTFPSENGQSCP